jgi:hypothetical protein
MSERLTNRDRQTDPLEQTLDLALASYTPGRPRLGLEERVRARIAVAGPIQRRTRLPLLWMGAVAAAAVLAAAVLLLVMLRSHTQPTPENLTAVQTGPPVQTVPIPGAHRAPVSSQGSSKPPRKVPQKPRLTPRPHTQEQLIAQLLASGPEAIASLARLHSSFEEQAGKPIAIQPLPADPLVIDPIKTTPIDDNPAEPGGSF